jgi:hypothetical protein
MGERLLYAPPGGRRWEIQPLFGKQQYMTPVFFKLFHNERKGMAKKIPFSAIFLI